MLRRTGRQLVKYVLSLARAKLLYNKITLTRFTTLYFFFALTSCIVLSALQGVTFMDNSASVSALSPFIKNISTNPIVLLDTKKLQTCTSIPNQAGTICTVKLNFTGNFNPLGVSVSKQETWHGDLERDEGDGEFSARADAEFFDILAIVSSLTAENCVISLGWVGEGIEDGKREDVVTLLFQIWLFFLTLVAILNESIPHLGAAFLGHVLNTAWAAYRIRSTVSLTNLYRSKIVSEACGAVDVMGSWWDIKLQHSISVLVVNSVVLLVFTCLSSKLYKVYANESFSRVGASPSVRRIYKIVLLFSVCLQLSSFFSLASTGMWLDKVCQGLMMNLTVDVNMYMAAFIVILIVQFPWLYLGWVCVRRECKIRFGIFCVISFLLLALSSALFFSPVYRYIFTSWPFFATLTVTTYALLVATSLLGVICRLNFGKGLAHYLEVADALEDADFTPVSFSESIVTVAEKINSDSFKRSASAVTAASSSSPITLQLPALAFRGATRQSAKERVSAFFAGDVYLSDPIKISSSPPLISELGPRPVFRRSRSSNMTPTAVRRQSVNYLKSLRKGKEPNPSFVSPVPTTKLDKASLSVEGDVLIDLPSRSSSVQASPILRAQGLTASPRGEKIVYGKEWCAGMNFRDNSTSI